MIEQEINMEINENEEGCLKNRSTAIHEAGHAVVAWYMRCRVYKAEIKTGDEPLVDLKGESDNEVIGWVFSDQGVFTGNGEFWKPETEADLFIARYYRGKIDMALPVCFAGVVAESVYTGESIDELLKNGGRRDAEDISKLLSVLRKMGDSEDEILSVRDEALNTAKIIVERLWWEITGIAMILLRWEILHDDEFYYYMKLFTRTERYPSTPRISIQPSTTGTTI
ncbi:TPA: hypothetical protein G8W54_004525 [Salmonella enterica]|nr:hypothetical protein [Salmonella enterica]EGE4648901.1 hypothetical protein [Salmonella enterica subsp. arizonae serovar 41:z4,z23:- str. 01-0089]EHK1228999.1 hypothetical protein [Salmonella enterica subsp. enterica serovar Poona]EAU4681021.1 hypothetical protein [Salmonella enterica]EAV0839450.1 hypothetical protein [Salmonella enterica]